MLSVPGLGPALSGATARRAAPGLWLAFALTGFFLYLGAIDLVGVEPNARITGPFYLVLAAGLLAVAWTRRELLRARARSSTRLERTWAASALLLGAWFLVTATLRSEGDVARDATFLLVVFCLPSVLAVLALRAADLRWFAGGLVTAGLVFACVSAAALLRLDEGVARFSPIDELDPISAATIAVVGTLACLTLAPSSRQGRIGQWLALVALVAAAVLPGARGPLLALAVGALTIWLVARRDVLRLASAVAVGALVGLVAAEIAGSTYYLGVDVPGIDAPAPTGPGFTGSRLPPRLLEGEPISSTDTRRELLRDALRAIPDRPLLGHGVGMLRADSEDMRRLVAEGRIDEEDTLTHPHSALVEAAYSLGLPGLALLLALVVTAAISLVRLVTGRARREPATLLAAGIATSVAVTANLSGELGMDAWLWVALALPIALGAARRERQAGGDSAAP
jgi:O-antigen ligase